MQTLLLLKLGVVEDFSRGRRGSEGGGGGGGGGGSVEFVHVRGDLGKGNLRVAGLLRRCGLSGGLLELFMLPLYRLWSML